MENMNKLNIEDLDALVLCGGLGTRLRKVIGYSQKVMTDVGGKPFLDLHIEHLKQQGVQRIVLCTGYKSEEVEEYYRNYDDDDIAIDFAREVEPLGTGGAIKNAEPIIYSDPFVVLNGDSFFPFNLPSLLEKYFEKEVMATIALAKVKDVSDYGTVVCDKEQLVTSFSEKVKTSGSLSGLVNAGVYCFSGEIFLAMPSKDKFSLEKNIFPKLAKEQQLTASVVKDEFHDIGTPERLGKFTVKRK